MDALRPPTPREHLRISVTLIAGVVGCLLGSLLCVAGASVWPDFERLFFVLMIVNWALWVWGFVRAKNEYARTHRIPN